MYLDIFTSTCILFVRQQDLNLHFTVLRSEAYNLRPTSCRTISLLPYKTCTINPATYNLHSTLCNLQTAACNCSLLTLPTLVPYNLHSPPHNLHYTSCNLQLALCTPQPTNCSLHLVYSLYPTFCHTTYTLHHITYTIHPTTYNLHSALRNLQTAACTCSPLYPPSCHTTYTLTLQHALYILRPTTCSLHPLPTLLPFNQCSAP